jgi:polyhydroxybutyrate depolymerase
VRSTTRAALGALVATLVVSVAACAPPAAPDPVVRPQPADRGRLLDVDVAPSSGCGVSDGLAAGSTSVVVPSGAGTRSARVQVPASATTSTPAPVLLSLHPFLVAGSAWESYSGLAAAALARGYVVITPEGSQPGPRWAVPGGLDTGVDDIGHLGRLLDQVEDLTCVDRNREFAAGFSAGAAMSMALSCTLPWRLAAVAGSGGANLTSTCPDSPATDVMVLHGTADPIAPAAGSDVVVAPPIGLSIDEVVATSAARAACAGTGEPQQREPDVVVNAAVGCDDDHRVEHWTMLGAGHTWAGAPSPLLELVTGPTTTSISANDVVLDFFDGV